MDNHGFEVILFDTVGVTLSPSPRYLQDEFIEEVDAATRDLVDEPGFWRRLERRFDLSREEIEEVQKRVAEKFCRNLNVWARLPELGRSHRLALVHSGSVAYPPYWERMFGLSGVFERVFESALKREQASDAGFYQWIAAELDVPAERCLLVNDERDPVLAARDAGMGTYRYGSAHGMMQAIKAGPSSDDPVS